MAKVAPGDILQVGAPMLAVRERDDEDALRAHSAALTPTQPRGVCHVAKLLGAKPAEVGNGAELIYEVEDVEGKHHDVSYAQLPIQHLYAQAGCPHAPPLAEEA